VTVRPGGLICEAVVGLEREFIGCEADSGRFAKAVERLRSQDA